MANAKEYKKWEGSVKKTRAGSKTQVLGRIFRRVFKPWTIPWPILTAIIPLVAVLVALFSQYVVVLPVKGSSALPGLILAGLIIGVPLAYKFRAKRIRGITLGAMIVIGFFLVPYFAFFLGKMNVYAVDQLPAGFKVKEMRVNLDHVDFVKPDNSGVRAQGSSTFTLYPGVTRIHIGTIDLPAGSYIGRNVYLSSVSVDVEVDITSWEGEYGLPYENLKSMFETGFASHGTITWGTRSESTVDLTLNMMAFQEFQSDPTTVMTYPGFGGPDVTLDFTLTEQGVVTVTPILDFPPGMGPPAGTTGGPPS